MKKSHAAGWNSDSPTPAQLKEFFSQVKSRRITKRNLQGFLRNSSILNENTARAIFGDDIIFPDEIAEARHLSYTKDQLRHFTETIPAEETLRALKAQNFALIAGPPSPMSLFDVRQIKSELFSKKICGYEWCEDYKIIKKFTSKDKVGTEWLAVRKEPVPGSFNLFWINQLELIKAEERVPNASEMSWIATTFFEIRGVWFFKSNYVRTSSVDLDGHQLHIGGSNSGGLLHISTYIYNDPNIGIASVQKFD